MHINLRSPTTQKWIIAVTLLFGMFYGYYNFVFQPRNELLKKFAVDAKHEADLLERGKRIAANYQAVHDDYGRLMKSWEMAHDLLPTQKEMEGLLKTITMEGQERDISFLLFKPLDPVEKPYYWENPIEIKTLSTYHKLGDFLSAVASMDRIVNVSKLKLGAAKAAKGRNPLTVEAEFVATIYIFKDLGAPTSSQASTAVNNPAQVKPGDEESAPAPKERGRKT
jgi:type IV pilus assembly protein PilO